jgi:hypothetical protein
MSGSVETADVAVELGLLTVPVRSVLAAYRLIERQGRGQGKGDLWIKCLWDQEESAANNFARKTSSGIGVFLWQSQHINWFCEEDGGYA